MPQHRLAAAVFPAPLVALVLAAALASPAQAWGPLVHQRVTGEAIDTLPKGLKPFYKDHRLEMPSLAVDAPPPGEEGVERRFQVDRLAPFPFADVPRDEAELKKQAGEDAARMGRLPWLIDEAYGRLVDAFRSQDKVRILAESDALAQYVSDLHNPLALTDNSDGQKTEQHGLWVRFSARLPEAMDKRLKLKPQAARLVDDPRAYVFSMVRQNYIWLDNLLYLEELARRGQSGYTDFYYEALADQAGGLLEDRLSAAATDVGSYWYTAWTAAGRPALK